MTAEQPFANDRRDTAQTAVDKIDFAERDLLCQGILRSEAVREPQGETENDRRFHGKTAVFEAMGQRRSLF